MTTSAIAPATSFVSNPELVRVPKLPISKGTERAEMRKVIQEEMRYQELAKKQANGETLTKDEIKELRYLTFVRKIENLAGALEPKVCYLA